MPLPQARALDGRHRLRAWTREVPGRRLSHRYVAGLLLPVARKLAGYCGASTAILVAMALGPSRTAAPAHASVLALLLTASFVIVVFTPKPLALVRLLRFGIVGVADVMVDDTDPGAPPRQLVKLGDGTRFTFEPLAAAPTLLVLAGHPETVAAVDDLPGRPTLTSDAVLPAHPIAWWWATYAVAGALVVTVIALFLFAP